MEKHYCICINYNFLNYINNSTIDIIKWKLDSNKTDKQTKEIQDFIEIEEVIEEEIEIIEQVEEIPQSNPYWDYIEMNLINVNFNELKKQLLILKVGYKLMTQTSIIHSYKLMIINTI